MRVLFTSGIDGFCHRYQVLHRAEQVSSLGGRCAIRHFADPRLIDEAATHDVLFLYRVPETAHVARAIERAHAAGAAVVGSIDDLIFVDDEALFPELADAPEDERALWLDGVRRYRATLERCDLVVVPTDRLLGEVQRLGWPAALHRNSVSRAELTLGREALDRRAGEELEARRGDDRAPVVLGYFSGTPTHDRDLATIAPALAQVLALRPNALLLLHGPVDPGPVLAPLAARVVRRPLVAWWELPARIAGCDINLAPLEIERRFAAAKGEIKVLEAALVGVPTVASPSDAFRHAIAAGENGRLARDVGEWVRALCELVDDAVLRDRLGRAARWDVEQRYSTDVRAPELADVLRRAGASRPSAARASRRPEPRVEPCVRAALEADAFAGAMDPAEVAAESPLLRVGAVLTQRLRPRCDGLFRLDLHTITFGNRLSGELALSLARAGGAAVASAVVAAGELPDRSWLALEMPTQERSKGEAFDLSLELRGAGAHDTLGFGLAPCAPEQEPARLDGAPLGGRLALRAFASWSRVLERAGGGSGPSEALCPSYAAAPRPAG